MSDTAVIFNIIGRDLTSPALARSGSAFNKFAMGLAASAAFAASKFIDMAADLQTAMTRVETGAGEAHANIAADMDGILTMMGEVGAKAEDLADGLYLVNSAGYHGAQGLEVLKIAAMGAKVGAADMHTTVDAITTALNAYHMGAGGAAQATNALIAAEAAGKTNLEALAAALPAVAPAAAVAGVRLNELLAAMSTMTAQGTPAANAATYLRQAIGQLSAPSAKARKEMEALGLNATTVSQTLGTKGLAAALKMVFDAIQSHMGPAGLVVLDRLKKMNTETGDYQKILANLPPQVQTTIGALANMTGGVKSMQAALQLTGPNMEVFQTNIGKIDAQVKAGGGEIEGWSAVQKNFNQRMAEAKGTVEALGIRIGNVLLPYAQKMLTATMSLVTWFTKHKTIAKDLGVVIGTAAAAFVAYRLYVVAAEFATKAWMIATKAWLAMTKVATAAQWLWNAAMTANPIGLIIIGVVALVAGIYLLWTHSAGFRNFFIGMWSHIWSFLKTVGAWFAGPFARFFVAAGKAIAAPFVWLWQHVIHPVVDAVITYWQFMYRIWSSVVHLVIDLIVMILVPYFMFLWRTAETVFHAIAAVVTWWWQNIITPAFRGVAAAATWLYQTVLLPIWHAIVAGLDLVGAAFTWWWQNIITPAFNGVAGVATWLWQTVLSPAWHAIVDGVMWMGGILHKVFDAVAGFIASAFTHSVSIAKGAINALITVIDSAIGGINTVLTKANSMPGVNFPLIPKIPHLAQGGIVQVGENGTEIVALPSGAAVYPHGSVPAGMARGGGGGAHVRFSGNVDTAFATAFMRLVRDGTIQITT